MRTGAVLLGLLVAGVGIPLLARVVARRWFSDVGAYLEDQHPVDEAEVNWPIGGGANRWGSWGG